MGPKDWAVLVDKTFDRVGADLVVAETNFGGAMVEEILRGVNPKLPFRAVKASRGKVVRAEPISNLFQQGKVKFCGRFPELEDQLCAMTTAGYNGTKSPDRADAMVWALHSLFTGLTRDKGRVNHQPNIHLGYAAAKQGSRRGGQPNVNLGYGSAKRR